MVTESVRPPTFSASNIPEGTGTPGGGPALDVLGGVGEGGGADVKSVAKMPTVVAPYPVLGVILMAAVQASTAEGLLALLEESWNRHDMVTYAAQFAADAFYVNAIGQEWHGHAEIERGHVAMHKTIFRDSRMTRMANRLQTVAEGVVIAVSDWEMEGARPPDGWIMHYPRQGIMTLVLVQRDGRWWIVAGLNTQKANINKPAE